MKTITTTIVLVLIISLYTLVSLIFKDFILVVMAVLAYEVLRTTIKYIENILN
jgi:hypothetical protein